MSNNFVITKNTDNDFVFNIKQDGSTELMVFTDTDSVVVKLIKLSDGTINPFTTTLTLANNGLANPGKVLVTIPMSIANSLELSRGDAEDRYYLKPMYKLVLLCDTANNGKFIAKVNEVMVDY